MGAYRDAGGVADGGGNANLGVLLRQTGESDKGLFLSARGADLTWHGQGESAGDAVPAVGGHIDLPNNGGGPGVNRHGSLRLAFPADIEDFEGALSNNITVRLFRNNTITSTPSVTWSPPHSLFLISVGPTTTIAQIRTTIDAFTTFTITNTITGDAIGTDVLDLPAQNATHRDAMLTGGADTQPPGIRLEARPDDATDGPNILVQYHPDHHTLQQIHDELEENDEDVTITVKYGTDLSAAPEAVPWTRAFSADGDAGEAPIDTTSGLTQSQVDARVRTLAKGFSLKGGPSVPDSALNEDIARDNEVPGLFRDALSDEDLSESFSERVPYLSGTDWHTVNLEGLRQRIKLYVGDWADTPGSFVFRAGDLTESNGQLFWAKTETIKNPNSGPETNDDFGLLSTHAGGWANRFFKAGTTCVHNGIVYFASANIARNAGEPQNVAAWLRISQDPKTVVRIEPKPSEPLTLTARNAEGTDTDVTIEGAGDSVIDASVTGGVLRLSTRAGAHHDETLPGGGTEVAANPAGSDGDVLNRIDIGGVNYIVNAAEVPVGVATLVGRNTSAAEKFPADLPDHTDPMRVPLPIHSGITDAGIIAASIDFPVVPLYAIATDGGIASNLDTTANSVELAEGMYIIGMGVQNIWLDATSGLNQVAGSIFNPGTSSHRANANQRISVECAIERWDGSNWVELSATNSPYTRQALWGGLGYNGGGAQTVNTGGVYTPKQHEGPGGVDASDDPAYNGDLSPVDAALYSVIAIPPGGAEIRFRMRRGHTMATPKASDYDETTDRFTVADGKGLGESGVVPWGYFCDVPGVSIFPLGRPTQTQPIVPRPHINLFRSTSGNLTPVAGDIGGTTYGYEYAIAQSAHAGSARIIGFKGSTKPSGSANVLATLTDLAHGSGTVDIPSAGATLAADEEYRLRLQVFAEGVTAGTDTIPDSEQDIVIRAHAAASASVHWTYVQYDSNDADAAATAARVDFANDIATYTALPESLTITVPADTNEYQLALSVKSDEPQPAGFTSSGVNASGSFYGAETRTVDSVEYKIYVLKPLFRVTSDDNGDSFGVTP